MSNIGKSNDLKIIVAIRRMWGTHIVLSCAENERKLILENCGNILLVWKLV